MAGSYYTRNNVKSFVSIETGDTSEDTLLDLLGALANQHIDNVLKQHDEKIPLQSTNVLEDIKLAADFYTASLYKGQREQLPEAEFWMKQYDTIISGMIEERSIDGESYNVDRFNSRYNQSDVFELW